MQNEESKEAQKLMVLGRRLLQTVHWLDMPLIDVLKEPELLPTRDLAKASKIASLAAERIAAWYPEVSSGLGTFLLDPNVVLTLGEARGQTEFCGKTTSKEIERLNELSAGVGIKFYHDDSDKPEEMQERMIAVTSRTGLEAVTAVSTLPGLPKFFANSDDDPWYWFSRACLETDALPELELTTEDRHHIVFGVMKGYPDRAVLALKTLDREHWTSTKIKCANFYNGAQPNYGYDPLDTKGVFELANIWGEALSQFYRSSVHTNIASQTAFVRERLQEMDATMKRSLEMNSHIPVGAESSESPDPFDRSLTERDAWIKMYARLK